jgi:hypothetical protein
MFGDWFYHQRIRKSVSVFGSLFDNIKVQRTGGAGRVVDEEKVPLAYAPKRDFLARIDQMNLGEDKERQIAIKLPRMSFEIVSMNYDPARQLPALNTRQVPTPGTGLTSQKLYTPVPYNIIFQLNIYAKTQDDALQIVEQCLPYFTPQYTVTINPLDGVSGVSEDIPIKLDGITFSDDYEGAIENRRTIIYTLDFEMKINLYKKLSTAGKVIHEVDTSLYLMDSANDTNSTKLIDYFRFDSDGFI